MAHVLIMPRQGNTVESCIIGEWKVKEGDTVAADLPVCVVETDKATFEVPAGAAGTVLKILREAGDDVPVLEPIMVLGEAGESWEAVLNASGKQAPAAGTEAGKLAGGGSSGAVEAGSGGGAGAKSGSNVDSGSVGTAAGGGVLGHDGGLAAYNGGGGGGGAGSAGKNANGDTGGAGGDGWKPSEKGAAWVADLTGTAEFSRGGKGGTMSWNVSSGADGAAYGDGGSGGTGGTVGQWGGAGHSGIVIVRWPYIY